MQAYESEESVLLEIVAAIPDAPRQVTAAALAAYLATKHAAWGACGADRERHDGVDAVG